VTRKDFALIEDILRAIRQPLKDDDAWMLVVLGFKSILAMKFTTFDQDKFLRNVQKQ
jgi:hypothetical protein